MTTRKELQEVLSAFRRARSLNLRSSAPSFHESARNLVGALAVFVILIASGAAMFFAVQLTSPKLEVTASPSASPSVRAPTTTSMATPVAMLVCTDIPNGRLHVRFAAGEKNEVRGYLAEGETVQVALDPNREMIQGDLWLRISSPIAGWVNARYLCKSE